MKQATGKFEVKSSPLEVDSLAKDIGLARMKFDKKFEGALIATSLVSMMGIMNGSLGSGSYVALEKVTGELESKKGTFCLQHSSSMNRGKPAQSITVVPDSGTDELAGIEGSMVIDIVEGQHFYTFNYKI